MPLIEITLPNNQFSIEQEQELATKATDILLELEGMQDNPRARKLTWVYLKHHNQNDFFMGGNLTSKPHYRFDVTVFADTLQDHHKETLTHRFTMLILDLEGTAFNTLNAARIWVMFHEVEDGNWGGAGQIYRRNDLLKMLQS
ncbi:MAG: hypothetical protein R3189_07390 [Thiomicrorhabdus chilensis]|uniref:tautomerase family protein n=1 Tax=Thiomicrorhabdus chilensis TaxID=63656 RepID=UPI00299DD1DD|nr:hypothetical protein [Thiomicrorhabdus chilensis]MDX1348057.1 hypothetical protein [Thiomicrorhabdus chilensis]